ncbi:MAG: sigma-70 family RNA polymerase sigma factor [Verrucomicrobiales bacterium]|nr:sigma-70 family RNA polymerase sigma factor [Verrucomicrobiales bacterium]
MRAAEQQSLPEDRGSSQFTTTHWSLVLAAGDSQAPSADDALEQLCRTYWQPVYAFVRRTVSNPEDARDLTQSFFPDLLGDRAFARADPEKGRFRSFLLGALKHFLADEYDKAKARKRGGHVEFVAFDTEVAESRYGAEPSSAIPPEAHFDCGWALAVLDRALARLREEFELSGRAVLFDGLKGFLTGGKPTANYSEAATSLRISEGAAKMTVTRMRQRFRAIVRQEIAQTVTTPDQLEAELRAFVEALAS